MAEQDPFLTALTREKFLSLKTPRDVASVLGIEYSRLIYHLHKVPLANQYTVFSIQKKGGGTREICAPISPIKLIQRSLLEFLESAYSPRPSVHGFVAGRSILSNARLHTGSRYVLNIDLENFFPSINFGRVRGMLLAHPYKLAPPAATILAQICCHNGALPQGAPTSPTISNMICSRLDGELQRLANEHHCLYSRYADDITFSTRRRQFPEAIAITKSVASGIEVEPGTFLQRVIQSNGFKINLKKVRLQRSNIRQAVTGLTVNEYPNVSRKLIREIRATLHNCKTKGLPIAESDYNSKYVKGKHVKPDRALPPFRDALKWKIEFLGMVRGKTDFLYIRFLKRLRDIAPDLVKSIPPADNRELIERALWIVESETQQGTAFMLKGYGLITCSHLLDSACYAYKAESPDKHFPVKIIAKGEDTLDLAILKIETNEDDSLVPGTINHGEADIEIVLAGYPDFAKGRSKIVDRGRILGWHSFYKPPRFFISRPIIYGNSGGPVLDLANKVVGVAIRGSGSENEGEKTSRHEAIPVSALSLLQAIP